MYKFDNFFRHTVQLSLLVESLSMFEGSQMNIEFQKVPSNFLSQSDPPFSRCAAAADVTVWRNLGLLILAEMLYLFSKATGILSVFECFLEQRLASIQI